MQKTTDLNDMMLFIAVIDAGSFTLAAERLNIPKANLSRKISRLEARLGVTLLERSTRSQHITEAGKNYLAHCRRIHLEVDLAEASIAQVLNKVEGQLKIGTSVGMGHEVLKPVLGPFIHQYPNLKLQLSLLNQLVDLIEEGFDVVIRIGEIEDSRLVAKRLGSVSRKIYASPDYLKRRGTITSVEQLEQHDLLLMNSIQNNGRIALQAGKKKITFRTTPKMLIDDFLILKQMTVDGVGIAIIPDYMCRQLVDAGELMPLLEEWSMPKVDVYALYAKHRSSLPKVKVFLDYIQTVFKEKLS